MNEFNHNQSQTNLPEQRMPDFSKIVEKPKKSRFKAVFFWALKIIGAILLFLIIAGGILAFIYYQNFTRSYNLSLQAKNNLETAIHKIINREFKEGADLIGQANSEFTQAQNLLDQIVLVRYIPYIGRQLKAVDQVLIAGIKLTDSGKKVVLLIDDVTAPLKNESITYASITPLQKKEILDKIVRSESMLYEVQGEIDEAAAAIDSIPEDKLVKPLRDGIQPLVDNLPKVKQLIDHALPLLKVIPKIAGFEQPKSYLFLLQNNSELRPTGGFIGTYGILKLQDGEIREFETDNVYNLDRSTQNILKEPSPWPIAKYLEQKYWSLRDINWAPDFPTTAEKALYMYKEENRIIEELKAAGKPIVSEQGTVITDTIPYQEVDGVIAMTPEIIEDILKLTGPITVQGTMFTNENLKDQLEFLVGKGYKELGISPSARKEVIKQLADQLTLKIVSLPFQRITDLLEIGYKSLDKKAILIYFKDAELEKLVLERNWGGQVRQPDSDYLFVVDTNFASLKTDQYVSRTINYSLKYQNNDLVGKVSIEYHNNADFTWKSSRLRSYTRVYVPSGSQLLSSSGAMENDKIKDPAKTPGQVEAGTEFGKSYFGAFISIEPHEIGTLTFEYKLPEAIKQQLFMGQYSLLVQKQPGVIPNLTLDLNFGKTIKSATPPEAEKEWFNTSYSYATALDSDRIFNISF